MFCANITGDTVSSTVTIALLEALLPEASITVRVTVFVPKSEQPNIFWLRLKLETPQLSLLPLFTSVAVVLAVPFASRYMVTFWINTEGAMASTTVTVAKARLMLLLLSVTVRVTVLEPMSLQLKLVLLRARLDIPQASELPLFISELKILAFPLASKVTVMFCARAVGLIVSKTVTVADAEALFPVPSVAVK